MKRAVIFLLLACCLTGCDMVTLSPSGDIAAQQRDLLLVATGLMLLIIVPVMVLTILFAWRYRESNQAATHAPDWHHSTQLELVIWAGPLLIVILLGAATWMGTHILDPYRKLGRIDSDRAISADVAPLEVEVVALDWKWLFIYPQFGIASLNELAAPVDRPISFKITSGSVMNSFYIPALAGQVYAMPGMQTSLNAVINRPGDFEGFSANYSGAGFSGMRFRFHGLDDGAFEAWVEQVRQSGDALDRKTYLTLEQPSENNPVRYFAAVSPDLFHAAVNLCVDSGKMCMDEMMRIDQQGGLGLKAAFAIMPLDYDKYARRGAVLAGEAGFIETLCRTLETPVLASLNQSPATPVNHDKLIGFGLPRPNHASEQVLSLVRLPNKPVSPFSDGH